jgi:hypothetical protein
MIWFYLQYLIIAIALIFYCIGSKWAFGSFNDLNSRISTFQYYNSKQISAERIKFLTQASEEEALAFEKSKISSSITVNTTNISTTEETWLIATTVSSSTLEYVTVSNSGIPGETRQLVFSVQSESCIWATDAFFPDSAAMATATAAANAAAAAAREKGKGGGKGGAGEASQKSILITGTLTY